MTGLSLSVIEAVARAMLADELSWSAPKRDFDTEWANEGEIWLKNARAAITAYRAADPDWVEMREALAGIERLAEKHTGSSGSRTLQTAMHAIAHAARGVLARTANETGKGE